MSKCEVFDAIFSKQHLETVDSIIFIHLNKVLILNLSKQNFDTTDNSSVRPIYFNQSL